MFAYTLKPQISNLEVLVDKFHEFCQTDHVPKTVERHLQMALDELVSNTIFYGKPDPESLIQISAQVTGRTLSLEIVDSGSPFNPFIREDPDTTLGIEERQVGGLGIFLVKKLMDHTSYKRVDNRNVVRFSINLEKEPNSNYE